ncbi:MAG: hypothetical protein II879_05930 [Clostridia bacterium]|nr:hypothetical protein [Clostridia bacterium]
MATIIPRWEWRTFGSDFKGADQKIMALNPSVKKSGEKYILSRNSNENCKIRDDLMDIKSPVNVNEDKLEQWYPTMKLAFPLSKEQVTELFTKYFKIDVPELADSYDYAAFVELCGQQKDLCVVDVKKVRYITNIDETIVEVAETEFNGVPNRTVCVEHIDPALVMSVVRKLGVEGLPNINYIRAMKDAVGF